MGQAVGCICGQDSGNIHVPKSDVTVENPEIIENSGMKASILAGELNNNNNNEEEISENTKYQLKSQIIKNKNEIELPQTFEDEFSLSLEKIAKLIPSEENNNELNKYTNNNILEVEKNLDEIDNSEQNNYSNTIIKDAYEFDNKFIYKGSWNFETYKKEGFGILIDDNGNKYIGYWKNDYMNGKGRLFNKDGDYFEGNFLNGDFTNGKLILKNGYIYEGDFLNGKKNGKGKEILKNEFSFEGNFSNGKRNGEGIYKWEDGSIYNGNFTNGIINGKGNFKWNDGRNYKGDFKNGIIEGKGEFIWPSGKKYIGDYKFNKKNGVGTYYWNDNIFYEGDWVNNQQHGNGIFNENNNKIKEIFRFGKLIKIEEGKLNEENEEEKKNEINQKIENKEIENNEENVIKLKKMDIPKGNKNVNNPMNMMIKNKLGAKKKGIGKKNGTGSLKRNVSVVPERESGDDDSDNENED